MYTYAMVGTQEKDSKREPGNKARDADLSDCMNYHEFCHSQCLVHPTPPQALTKWMVDRDHQTRVQARQLHSDGWPFGEALRESREKALAVLWTIGPTLGKPQLAGGSDRAPGPAEHPPSKRARHPEIDLNSLTRGQCCGQWNSTKGCARKQRDCPQGKLHKCSAKTKKGDICGAWNHTSITHAAKSGE
jgi:hypothetical protein